MIPIIPIVDIPTFWYIIESILQETAAIIDEEIRALAEPSPALRAVRGPRCDRRWRRRAISLLLHADQRLAGILSGSLAEQLQDTPPTQALQAHIAQKLIDLFWTVLPERDDRWLRATNVAYGIADSVIAELAPRQVEDSDIPEKRALQLID